MDDGSTDGTAAAAQALDHPRLRVLRHEQPEGEGRALRAGLAALTQPLLAYAPCLPEYRPEHLGLLLDRPMPEEVEGQQGKEIDHVHLISGYRAGTPVPGLVRVMGWMWRLFCRVVFNYPVAPLPGWLGVRRHLGWLPLRIVFALRYHDTMCPMRVLRREVLTRIPLQSKGPFAHVELLAKANFLGAVFGGEPVPLPVVPPSYRGDLGALWADMRRVMNEPDFGPAAPAAQGEPGLGGG